MTENTVVGGAVALLCDFHQGSPTPEVQWYAVGDPFDKVPENNDVLYVDGGRYLFICQLTAAQRDRTFHCAVTNVMTLCYDLLLPMCLLEISLWTQLRCTRD